MASDPRVNPIMGGALECGCVFMRSGVGLLKGGGPFMNGGGGSLMGGGLIQKSSGYIIVVLSPYVLICKNQYKQISQQNCSLTSDLVLTIMLKFTIQSLSYYLFFF